MVEGVEMTIHVTLKLVADVIVYKYLQVLAHSSKQDTDYAQITWSAGVSPGSSPGPSPGNSPCAVW